MSVENPYEQLGISENATFDEIQAARNRLVQEYSNDPKRQEAIETAYDAILMERLRMRQEGKIRVPEGIRFAERMTQAPPKAPPAPAKQPPACACRSGVRRAPTEMSAEGACSDCPDQDV